MIIIILLLVIGIFIGVYVGNKTFRQVFNAQVIKCFKFGYSFAEGQMDRMDKKVRQKSKRKRGVNYRKAEYKTYDDYKYDVRRGD